MSTNEDEESEKEIPNQVNPVDNNSAEQNKPTNGRPVRTSATKAADKISEWTEILRRPPEDVEDID
jgi:hypothetical protein